MGSHSWSFASHVFIKLLGTTSHLRCVASGGGQNSLSQWQPIGKLEPSSLCHYVALSGAQVPFEAQWIIIDFPTKIAIYIYIYVYIYIGCHRVLDFLVQTIISY